MKLQASSQKVASFTNVFYEISQKFWNRYFANHTYIVKRSSDKNIDSTNFPGKLPRSPRMLVRGNCFGCITLETKNFPSNFSNSSRLLDAVIVFR